MRNRFNVMAIVVIVLGITTAVASGAGADQGRRITGPICVGKRDLKPIHIAGFTIPRAGGMRSVARTQDCRSDEDRKLGVAVPDIDPVNTGPAGATGPQGPQGGQGPAGVVHVDQLTGDQANCVKITGSDGSSGIICGFKKKECPPIVVESTRHTSGASGGYGDCKPPEDKTTTTNG